MASLIGFPIATGLMVTTALMASGIIPLLLIRMVFRGFPRNTSSMRRALVFPCEQAHTRSNACQIRMINSQTRDTNTSHKHDRTQEKGCTHHNRKCTV